MPIMVKMNMQATNYCGASQGQEKKIKIKNKNTREENKPKK